MSLAFCSCVLGAGGESAKARYKSRTALTILAAGFAHHDHPVRAIVIAGSGAS
jgi:hypothetical protein